MNAINDLSGHRRTVVSIAVYLTTCVFAISASAYGQNLVTNGSFESPGVVGQFTTYYGVDSTILTGWVVDQAGTSVNHVNTQWNDADGFQSIDMNGLEAGSIYQDLSTAASQRYKVRFALAGNPEGYSNKRLEVLWDGAPLVDLTFVQAGHNPVDMGWTYRQRIVTAGDSSTRLTFNSLNGAMLGDAGVQSWYGPVLDDVSVTAIPEPSALMLALLSLLLAPLARRCTRRIS